MRQSRRMSLLEAVVSTVLGFGLAVASTAWVFPLVGVRMTVGQNLATVAFMTALSVVRGYVVRRVFEALRWRVSP